MAKSTETSRLIVEDFERRWQPGIRAAQPGRGAIGSGHASGSHRSRIAPFDSEDGSGQIAPRATCRPRIGRRLRVRQPTLSEKLGERRTVDIVRADGSGQIAPRATCRPRIGRRLRVRQPTLSEKLG
ncbi:hypothetical protein CTI14_11560, partial [Methylobacterium radiotolerans]